MIILGLIFTAFVAMGSVPFAAILIGIPKGEGVISPDTERFLSFLYGVFIRPSMTIVGFAGSMAIGFIGMSIFNLIWFTAFFNKLGGLSTIDSISFIIFIFAGYGIGLFFICLYSFRVTTMFVDVSGVWFSSVLAGGALGNNDADVQATTQGIQSLSSQLNNLSDDFKADRERRQSQRETKTKNQPNNGAGSFNA
jgi:outer membrane murein-binding lipoprotein Lpp